MYFLLTVNLVSTAKKNLVEQIKNKLNEQKIDKKRKSTEQIKLDKPNKTKKKENNTVKKKMSKKRFEVGWKHRNSPEQPYTLVSEAGGRKYVSYNEGTTIEEALEEVKALFLPYDRNDLINQSFLELLRNGNNQPIPGASVVCSVLEREVKKVLFFGTTKKVSKSTGFCNFILC